MKFVTHCGQEYAYLDSVNHHEHHCVKCKRVKEHMENVSLDTYRGTVDAVEEPSHYRAGGYELAEVLSAFGLKSFAFRFMAVQYIVRAHAKHAGQDIEDLRKARQYLDWEIRDLEKAMGDLERGTR